MNLHHERVQERAYALWVEEGCVHGRADDYWFRAERELRHGVQAAPAEPRKAPAKRRAPRKRAA